MDLINKCPWKIMQSADSIQFQMKTFLHVIRQQPNKIKI